MDLSPDSWYEICNYLYPFLCDLMFVCKNSAIATTKFAKTTDKYKVPISVLKKVYTIRMTSYRNKNYEKAGLKPFYKMVENLCYPGQEHQLLSFKSDKSSIPTKSGYYVNSYLLLIFRNQGIVFAKNDKNIEIIDKILWGRFQPVSKFVHYFNNNIR